ncbi:metallophosphoesterase [bacterium]|nr:metallophosphoesterase [bacterium]
MRISIKVFLIFTSFLLSVSAIPVLGQALPFFDNFNDGDYDGWTVYDIAPYEGGPSNWVVIGGALTQTSNIFTTEDEYSVYTGTRIIAGDPRWNNYSFTVELKSTDDDGVGLLFRYQNEGDYYRYIRLEDAANGGPFRRIERCDDSVFTLLSEDTSPISYSPNFYCVTVWVSRDSIKVFEEGSLIVETSDPVYDCGKIGFMGYANSGSHFDNVAVLPGLIIDSSASNLRVEPYIQNPEATSITIMWETTDYVPGKVYWGSTLDFTDSMDAAISKIHEVKITGLSPETRYYYGVRLPDTLLKGEDYYFNTKPQPTTGYRMCIWGDNRTDYISCEHVVNAMVSKEPDLVVNVGDVVTSGEIYDQWVNEYFWPARTLLRNTASYISIGNHEVDAAYFDNYVDQPNNEHWFSVRYGPAYLIFIDTNRLYFPLSPQYNWLFGELSSSEAQSAPWLLVFHHHPPYSEGWDSPGYDGEAGVRDYLVPLYEYYDVDICFAGHTHDYERGEKNGVMHIITGGGGAALDSWQQEWEYIDIYHSVYHYIVLDIGVSYIMLRCYDWDNSLMDSTLLGECVAIDEENPFKMVDVDITGVAPNPFNSIVRIDYYVTDPAEVSLSVFDISGRMVAKIVEGKVDPGAHSAWWDARETKRREPYPSGVYLVKLRCGDITASRKITLVK